MEYTKLANGMQMPMLGYGVFQIDDETTERCVSDALAAGYRLIDTAQAYMNERGVGAAIDALDTDHSICYDHTDLTVVGGLLGFIKGSM